MNNEQTIQLENLINYHRKQYQESNPEISDDEFDELVNKLKELDPENEIIYELQSSLPPKKDRKKVIHKEPLLSLNKVFSKEDLIKWAEGVSRSESEVFVLQPKYDGISANYENLILSTRGRDGYTGEDITDKIELIHVVIKKNDPPIKLDEINDPHVKYRGELIMRKDFFESNKKLLLRKSGKQYSTPRSAVAGILNRDDLDLSFKSKIYLICFDAIETPITLSQMRLYDFEKYFQSLRTATFDADGIVIKLQDENYKKSLGTTSHHPRGEIAFKGTNPTGQTTLLNIDWSIGKGTLTPVGNVEEVNIKGYNNRRVNLHNYKFILDNDIAVGDKIVIQRAGEIIPQYHSTIEKPNNRQPIQFPKQCPYCKSNLFYEEPEVKCSNDNCSGMLPIKLNDALIRLGFKNIGKSTIEKMIDVLGVSKVSDILVLTKQDFLKLEGFKDKSAQNAEEEINKIRSKQIEEWRVVSALNIPGIGTRMSRTLLENTSIKKIMNGNKEDLIAIDSIGPERADVIFNGIHNNIDEINYIKNLLNISETQSSNKNTIEICFTGKGPKTRNYYKNICEEKRYIISSSVTQKTNLLVTDDFSNNSSKMKKARTENIKIISYDEFMKYYL